MNTLIRTAAVLLFALVLANAVGCSNHRRAENDVDALLDKLHAAAAEPDACKYWSCFTPNAVFLGTDGNERWTIDQFRDYAKPLFDNGKGWVYTPHERHISLSQNAKTAWFDERLENAKYGDCRGTGVAVKTGSGRNKWRISQYSLSVPIPNYLLPEVTDRIKMQQPRSSP